MTDLIAHAFKTLSDVTTLAQLIRRQRALSKVTVECYLHHAGKVSSDTMEYLTNSEYHTWAAVESENHYVFALTTGSLSYTRGHMVHRIQNNCGALI